VASYDLSLYAIYLASSYYYIAHTHLLVRVWILCSAQAVPRGQQTRPPPVTLLIYMLYMCPHTAAVYVSSYCSAQAVPPRAATRPPPIISLCLYISYHSTYIYVLYVCAICVCSYWQYEHTPIISLYLYIYAIYVCSYCRDS